MPWKIKKRGSKFCVYKPDTGEIVSCKHKTRGEAEAHKRALYANAGHKLESSTMTVSMRRPVMLGVALTNRPHVRLKGHPIQVLEDGDKTFLRVPFMISGKYHHPHGDLDITEEVLDKFLENLQAGVADNELGLDARHKPELGSIAWFEQNLGGKVVKEKLPEGGFALVGYGVPTGPDSVDLVKQGKFRYASLEFHPNYRSNVKQRYLSDDLELPDAEVINLRNPYTMKQENVEMENTMPFELKVQEDGTVVLEAEEVEALKGLIADSEEAADKLEALATKLEDANTAKTDLEAKVEDAASKIAELEGQIKNLTKEAQPEKTEREIALETRIVELERGRATDKVEMIIANAKSKVDENGNGHSAVFLELARKLMLGEEVKVDDTRAISLEDAANAADYGRFVREVVELMLNTVPGQMRVESDTTPEDDTKHLSENSETDNLYDKGKEDAATIWSAA